MDALTSTQREAVFDAKYDYVFKATFPSDIMTGATGKRPKSSGTWQDVEGLLLEITGSPQKYLPKTAKGGVILWAKARPGKPMAGERRVIGKEWVIYDQWTVNGFINYMVKSGDITKREAEKLRTTIEPSRVPTRKIPLKRI